MDDISHRRPFATMITSSSPASCSWLSIAATSTLLLLLSQFTTSFSTTSPLINLSSSSQLTSSALQVAASTPTTTSTDYDIVKVDLTDGRDYPIYIGSDFTDDEASTLLRKHIHGKRVLLITNDKIEPLYLAKYTKLLQQNDNNIDEKDIQVDTVVLPDGEENKTFDCMSMILNKALELGLDRKSTFVALGGGVIGDMVGFAAAIYQRGVNFIQVCLIRK